MEKPSNINVVIFIVSCLITLFVVIVYSIYFSNLNKQTKSKTMKKELNSLQDLILKQYKNTISTFNSNDASYKNKSIYDFYILSSYNSCCAGNLENDYVDLQSLINVIQTGARFLDFQIYSYNGEPVVASSDNDSIYAKGSYNYLNLTDVFEIVNNHSFSAGTCPNSGDPLFIHLRLNFNSNEVNKDIYDTIASIYTSSFPQSNRASMKYNYQMNGENIFAEDINNFRGKTILILNKSVHDYSNTLDECTNAVVDGVFLQNQRNYDIVNTHDTQLVIDHNKKNCTIVSPDLSTGLKNIDFGVMQRFGCQFVCMNMQNIDSHLVYTLNFFNKNQSAFVLKPKELRYQPVTIQKPLPQNPKLSYSQRLVQKPYFSHII